MNLVGAPARIAFKNVLLATDLSPDSGAALTWAEGLARRYGSKLFVTHVISPAETALLPPEYWGSSQQLIEEAARRQLDDLDASLENLPHEIRLEHGGVMDILSAEIETSGIDLLVLGTHGRGGLGRLTMGSAAEELLRRVRCPVLTVGPGAAPCSTCGLNVNEIVFATAFGPESLAAAPYAISFAEEFHSALTLLNVMDENDFDLPADPQVALRSRLERLRHLVPAETQLERKPEFILEFGEAAEQILRVAQERSANLIVLGAKSRAHLGAATHISAATAHKVVSLAFCPVLTVCG